MTQPINREAYERMARSDDPRDRAFAKMGLFIATNEAIEYTDNSRVFLVESDPFTPGEEDTRWSTYWHKKGKTSLHHYRTAPYFLTPLEAQLHLNMKAKERKWTAVGPRQIVQTQKGEGSNGPIQPELFGGKD